MKKCQRYYLWWPNSQQFPLAGYLQNNSIPVLKPIYSDSPS